MKINRIEKEAKRLGLFVDTYRSGGRWHLIISRNGVDLTAKIGSPAASGFLAGYEAAILGKGARIR